MKFIFNRLPRGVYPSRISWKAPDTLAIACAKNIKIIQITAGTNYDHQSAVPRKHLNTSTIIIAIMFVC